VLVHIAFVTETYPPELNGVSATVARAVGWLRARGHLVQLVRPRQRGESERNEAEEWRVPGLALPMYRDLRMGLPVHAGLIARWTMKRPDVIHVATEGPLGWAACRAGRRLGVPVTSDLRTNFDLYSNYYGLGFMRGLVTGYLRAFHNATDCTFVPTSALAANLRERGFERLSVVGRGVDAEQFSPTRRSEQLRQAWGATPADPVILHVGRLAAEKNIPLVLRAFESIRTLQPRARLVIVGTGPLSKLLERAAPPAVLFIGELRGQELAEHYASSDIFLFPSLTETFGNVTLEALASGLVVVAFDVAATALCRKEVRGLIRGALAGIFGAYGGYASFALLITYVIRYEPWVEGGVSRVVHHIFAGGSLAALAGALLFPVGLKIGSEAGKATARKPFLSAAGAVATAALLWTIGRIIQ
jgi:glycosyltransferase involved in cell wall biosynthesis